jgi:hypothetical protein
MLEGLTNGAERRIDNLSLAVRDDRDVLGRAREEAPHDHHGASEGFAVPARPAPNRYRYINSVQCAGHVSALVLPDHVGSEPAVVRADMRLNVFKELEESGRAGTP